MLDANLLRGEVDSTAERLKTRGFELDVARLNELESRRKDLQVRTQELQNERNSRSKSIGQAKGRGEDIAPLLAEVGQLGEKLDAAKNELNDVLEEIKHKPDENSAVKWIEIDRVHEFVSEPRMLPIYDKMIKSARYLLSCNADNIE